MSIKEVPSYELRCDGCNVLFETEFAIWTEIYDARDEAQGWDWTRIGEKDYCPECSK